MTFSFSDEHEDSDGRNVSESRELLVKSANDIFYKGKRKCLNVYILGEAGSGKSAFCKYIVHAWCLTHSKHKPTYTQTLDVRDCLKNFDFLFFLSLRHNTHQCSIKSMLQEQYGEPVLEQILDKDSASCLILMDGLDEWSKPTKREITPQFQTDCIPDRNHFKRYTVVTTSRPWKTESLNLTDSEQNHIIRLRGIDNDAIADMSKKYIDELNKLSEKTKSHESIMNVVTYSQLSEMKNVPVILQQLICLAFDDRLPSTSTCAIFRSMLDLMIEWAVKRNLAGMDFEEIAKMSSSTESTIQKLDDKNNNFIVKYSAVVTFASKLAFRTLFSNNKETSISFDQRVMTELEIPDTIERCCIKIGILTEEQSVSILPSRQNVSSFSFMHKSLQEFLAAMYIASQRKISMNRQAYQSSLIGGRFQACRQYVRELFKCLKTTEDVLNFSNVIVMLCGLDTVLTVHLSELIDDILKNDTRISKYVDTVQKPSDCNVISDIQKLTFKYIKEHITNGSNLVPLNLENITFDKGTWKIALLKYIDPMKIVSLGICLSEDTVAAKVRTIFEYLTHCQQIKKIYISDQWGKTDTELSNFEGLLVNNIDTLQCISVKLSRYVDKNPLGGTIVDLLPRMSKLRSIKLSGISLSQNQCSTLSTFFTENTHLQQVALKWIECKDLRAKLDLSRHDKLQYLKTMGETFDIKALNLQNLETFTMNRTFENTLMDALCLLQNAPNLKYLSLGGLFIKSNHANLTDKLLQLILSLPALTTLKVEYFTFQDNFLLQPGALTNMKTIKLFGVRMKQNTWCRFVESIALLPNRIQVQTRSLEVITTDNKWSFKKHMKELREKFEITFDWGAYFHFSLK